MKNKLAAFAVKLVSTFVGMAIGTYYVAPVVCYFFMEESGITKFMPLSSYVANFNEILNRTEGNFGWSNRLMVLLTALLVIGYAGLEIGRKLVKSFNLTSGEGKKWMQYLETLVCIILALTLVVILLGL